MHDAGESLFDEGCDALSKVILEKKGAEIYGIRPKLHSAGDKVSCDRQKTVNDNIVNLEDLYENENA
ncbi:MAG: hypothetical protein ABSE16_16935 [Verrucomicrobiota bacterium]